MTAALPPAKASEAPTTFSATHIPTGSINPSIFRSSQQHCPFTSQQPAEGYIFLTKMRDMSSSDTATAVLERRVALITLNDKRAMRAAPGRKKDSHLLPGGPPPSLVKFPGSPECWMSKACIQKRRERGQARSAEITDRTDENQLFANSR